MPILLILDVSEALHTFYSDDQKHCPDVVMDQATLTVSSSIERARHAIIMSNAVGFESINEYSRGRLEHQRCLTHYACVEFLLDSLRESVMRLR